MARLLAKAGRTVGERAGDGKSAEGKRALAAALQAQTPVTNRWLGEPLELGNLHAVSRKVAEGRGGRLSPGASDRSSLRELSS